jgi:hypothetical protein
VSLSRAVAVEGTLPAACFLLLSFAVVWVRAQALPNVLPVGDAVVCRLPDTEYYIYICIVEVFSSAI